jgi:hypothetical protein
VLSVPIWYRVACYVMAALLLVSVGLQYNDPDPIRWMVLYGSAAITSILLPSNKRVVPLGYLIVAAAVIWAIILLVDIWGEVSVSDIVEKMSEKGGAVEEERELGGLAITGVWTLFASWFRSRRP